MTGNRRASLDTDRTSSPSTRKRVWLTPFSMPSEQSSPSSSSRIRPKTVRASAPRRITARALLVRKDRPWLRK